MQERFPHEFMRRSDQEVRAVFGTGMTALGFVLEGAQEPGTAVADRFPAPENIANLLQAFPVDMKAFGAMAAAITCTIGVQSYVETRYPGSKRAPGRFLGNRVVQAGLWFLSGTANYLVASEVSYLSATSVGTSCCAIGLYGALYRRRR